MSNIVGAKGRGQNCRWAILQVKKGGGNIVGLNGMVQNCRVKQALGIVGKVQDSEKSDLSEN